ncbi:MAG: TonB-dependent receptor [Halieaceae bacterium]
MRIRNCKRGLVPCLTGLLLSAPWVIAAPAKLEQVTVTAKHTRTSWSDSGSLLNAPLLPNDAAAPVSTVAELVQQQPGVAYAGQGGLLQTVSIRGISGQQVANYWGNIPITSERRAGTASSFIDPVMLGSVEILRGPASVYYGNGAVAGVMQMSPARPAATEWSLQYGSDGDENLQYLATGNERSSLALSRRSADDSNTPDGTPLHTEFEQYNAQLLYDFQLGEQSLEFQQLISEGRDIGKSNVQFPDQRITDYPKERHWLGQLNSSLGQHVDGSLYYHYQKLDTRVERPGQRINEVSSKSLDFGARLSSSWRGSALPYRFGLEYFGRRNVEAREKESSLADGGSLRQQTLDAEQDGLDVFVDGYRQFNRFELAAGLRWAWLKQEADQQQDVDDNALSGFIRANWAATDAFSTSLELASGVRFAGLSERYFSGTTGRGQVLGNPRLDPEDTLGADLGLRWQGQRAAIEVHAFGTRIDDYIERVDINSELRGFRNLTEGEIYGVELAAQRQLGENWTLSLGGSYVEGEDDDGNNLADITPATALLGIDYSTGPWQAELQFSYRFKENDVADGELPTDSARLLSAGLSRDWGNGLQLRLWARNLLDETWRLSSDDLATEGPERALGLTLSWRQH